MGIFKKITHSFAEHGNQKDKGRQLLKGVGAESIYMQGQR